MRVRDIIDELNLGEMNSANLGHNDTEGVTPFNHAKVISYINAALTVIYSRQLLSEREVLIELVEGKSTYYLNSKYAQSNIESVEPIKYLVDAADPFDDRILKILSVYNENGLRFPLDDRADETSLFRPDMLTLQIPYPVTGTMISVLYQSAHKKLDTTGAGILDQVINLPVSYSQAIINYVMYKHKASFDTVEMQQASLVAMKTFDVSLEALSTLGLSPEDNVTSTKFGDRGWV